MRFRFALSALFIGARRSAGGKPVASIANGGDWDGSECRLDVIRES
jgi:hypothetical protein